MPSAAYLETDNTLDFTALDEATVYWFGRITGGGGGLVWSHGYPNPTGMGVFVESGDQLRVKMLDSINNPNEWVYDLAVNSLHDEHICVATVIDLSLPSVNQITSYINGSSVGWTQFENFALDSFGDFVLTLGDSGLLGVSPTRCQAFVIFPEAHTQAQVQAVSDDWFEKSGVNL